MLWGWMTIWFLSWNPNKASVRHSNCYLNPTLCDGIAGAYGIGQEAVFWCLPLFNFKMSAISGRKKKSSYSLSLWVGCQIKAFTFQIVIDPTDLWIKGDGGKLLDEFSSCYLWLDLKMCLHWRQNSSSLPSTVNLFSQEGKKKNPQK